MAEGVTGMSAGRAEPSAVKSGGLSRGGSEGDTRACKEESTAL